MKHFTVLYGAPKEVLREWMSKPEEERRTAEAQMKKEWDSWLSAHKDTVLNTIGLGKTKKVTSAGVEDAPNEYMLSSYVAGESAEEVASLFKDHPHFGIPGAYIEVMEAMTMQ